MTLRAAAFTLALLFAMLLSPPAMAQAPPHQDAAAVGKALSNPVSDVWALFTEFDFAWNDGDINSGSDRVSYTTLFQPVMPFKFTENSKLITRPTFPIIWSQPVPGPDGSGGIDFDRKHGLGDFLLPVPPTGDRG